MVLFALLVAVPVAGTSAYLLYSSYQDNKRALIRLQLGTAKGLATSIEQSLTETSDRLQSTHGAGLSRGDLDLVLRPLLIGHTLPLRVFYASRPGSELFSIGPGVYRGGLAVL
jgi:hypothetical protein